MFDLDLRKTTHELVRFIQDACQKESCSDLLIAVSGGVDSATSLSLGALALGSEHLYPVLLPYGKMQDEGLEDARMLIDELSIPHENVTVVDIKPSVEIVTSYDKTMDEGRIGNVMARMRMVYLYDLVKKYNYLVLGTENKSEHLLGYFTRFGDEASDIEPLRNLYKTQVFMLAEYLKVPDKILSKSPSAGLWEGQTDENEFGFSYKLADEVLFLHTAKHLSKDEIVQRGYHKELVEKIWWWIEKGNFKNRLPYIS